MKEDAHCIDNYPDSDHLKATRVRNDGIPNDVKHHCSPSAMTLPLKLTISQTKRNAYALDVTSDTFAMIGLPTATAGIQPVRLFARYGRWMWRS